MYIHVNIELVLKATRANKELYSSSLVVSPKKECKQDRINHSLHLLLLLHTYGLALSMGDCTFHVICWVVTTNECLSQLMNISHALESYPNVSNTKPISTRQSLINWHSQMTFSTNSTWHIHTGISTCPLLAISKLTLFFIWLICACHV